MLIQGTFWYYGFSGTLSSDTAYISEMRQWENGKKITKESINTELAYCLPENTTYGTFSLNKGRVYLNIHSIYEKKAMYFIQKIAFQFSELRFLT